MISFLSLPPTSMRPKLLVLAFLLPLVQASTTLVDALSQDPEYSSLLRLLQRAKLIPTLNRLNGSTFFAPTNDAIHKHALWNSALNGESTDNIHEELRQTLFYHLLNYTAPPAEAVSVHKTLLFPRTPLEPPSRSPPTGPPWMPVPGGTLGGEPQRLRITSRDGRGYVGVDAFGKGGASIIKETVHAGNGILLGIDRVLEQPANLAHVVSQQASTSYFHKILNPAIAKVLNETNELTLFLPVDAAWASLHPLERLYLESEFATDGAKQFYAQLSTLADSLLKDLTRILNMHAVVQKGVVWSQAFTPGVKLTTLDGQVLDVIITDSGTRIGTTAELVHPDIYAANGVLHTVSSLLIPEGALKLTPEKYLLALNCTSFVSLLHSVDLTSFINNTEAKFTILAPRDDVINLFGNDQLPEKGSDELRRMLAYHFLPGRWTPKRLKDGMLVETALLEKGLDENRQVLSVDSPDGKRSNLKFGGAGVLEDPIEIDNTIIYFISRPLAPPSDVLQTALPSLELSSFLAAIFSTSLADLIKKTSRTSLLIPRNSAWKSLGMLVSDHLLSASSKPDLEKVIMHHVLDGVVYATALQNGTQRTFPTLEGSDVQLARHSNGSLMLSASGGWAGMQSEITVRDMLTQTGVIHELSDVVIPRSVEINVGKLVKAAKASTMPSLISKAGMDWILNGTAPPSGSPWEDMHLEGAGWTLLCPTDDAFKTINLTILREDKEGLRKLLGQHIIPSPPSRLDLFSILDTTDALNNNRPLPMTSNEAYATLLSPSSAYGDLVFRESEGAFVVGIKNARGTEGREDWAKVLSWGRTTSGGGPPSRGFEALTDNAEETFIGRPRSTAGTGGVVLIDRLLVPYEPPLWVKYGGPGSVLVGGILAIAAFFALVRYVWRMDMTEATYEPLGGFRAEDEEGSG